LRESVPLEKWREIVETAVAQAVVGDAKAREWLASYLIGKPFQAVAVEEPQGPRLSIWALLAAIREAVPDGEAQARIANVLARMGREAAGDGPCEGSASLMWRSAAQDGDRSLEHPVRNGGKNGER
jgi:hypothetical protein